MPELPEVETTRRGIEPLIKGAVITCAEIRKRTLRLPVTPGIEKIICGQAVRQVTRRAKYLVFQMDRGELLVHLGMSGSLRILEKPLPFRQHDHIQLSFDNGRRLRFHDPRRFGLFLWCEEMHSLLKNLGPEPLADNFNGDYLYQRSRRRTIAVKPFLMDQQVVVGVGNIYASEALFASGIRPDRQAGRISLERYRQLADNVKKVLGNAIEQGGTTLRDFVNGRGEPGYFQQALQVYGRAGQSCVHCGRELREMRLGQRSTVYCIGCQR